ncbi:MAG: hypothetical protein KBA61_10190 [Spirochaetes bacterium]|nr:hypothetical protein [Spirochaetota bacterium]
MKSDRMTMLLAVITSLVVCAGPVAAGLFGSGSEKSGKKMVYVRSFELEEGFSAADPIKDRVKEIIQEVFQVDNRYQITTDEDIAVFMEKESKMMSLGKCSSDACVRKLMEKINAEVLIYGRVRKINEFTYITARLMDKSSGMPKVRKIRTIKYHYEDFFEKGARSLGKYLLSGNDSEVRRFMDDVYEREEHDQYEIRRNQKRGKQDQVESDYRRMVENAARERKEMILSRSSQFRFGLGIYNSILDEELNRYFPDQNAYFLDWIIRLDNGPSVQQKYDAFVRGMYRRFRMNDTSIDSGGVIGKDVITESKADMFGLDIGGRVRFQQYFMMTAFDFYLLGGLRYQYYYESAEDTLSEGDDIHVSFHSLGVYTGAGIEIAFFDYVGLFLEYNIGYTPVGTKPVNVEGNQFYAGATYRSQSARGGSCLLLGL